MGKRTLRTLHYELVASVINAERAKYPEMVFMTTPQGVRDTCARTAVDAIAHSFADEFEIRAETFDRKKFLASCGLEE